MTPLGAHIAALVASHGPIAVADYMALALGHPVFGYYMTRDPLGAAGDFVTAPEISQMFGELIGLWCADQWQQIGTPERVVLAELGPGRGTLMADALRAVTRALPAFANAADIHLVETSPALRAAQARALGGRARWHDTVATLPEGPILLIANEFFDALPVRQFVRTPRGWCERCVRLDGERLQFALAPDPAPLPAVPDAFVHAATGAVMELSPARESVAADIAHRIAARNGAALIIDYGHHISAPGDTLQALKAHQYCDPLAEPGEADVTAHVDFAALARACEGAGARVHGPVTQGEFLKGLGILERAARLKRGAAPQAAQDVDRALHRLTSGDEMGDLFKAMAITSPQAHTPAGF